MTGFFFAGFFVLGVLTGAIVGATAVNAQIHRRKCKGLVAEAKDEREHRTAFPREPDFEPGSIDDPKVWKGLEAKIRIFPVPPDRTDD